MGVITDPLADLLVRIRNANQRQHKTVNVPYSYLKVRFVRKMVETGYLLGYNVSGKLKTKTISVKLKFVGSKPALRGLKRVSTPGLRVYVTTDKIPWVLSGYGVAVLSTSQGILTDKEARKAKVGGEVLAYLW